jgi:hypothetical protein
VCSVQVKILAGLKASSVEERAAYDALRAELLTQWPKHLPVHTEWLERASTKLKEAEKADKPEDVRAACTWTLEAADKVRASKKAFCCRTAASLPKGCASQKHIRAILCFAQHHAPCLRVVHGGPAAFDTLACGKVSQASHPLRTTCSQSLWP